LRECRGAVLQHCRRRPTPRRVPDPRDRRLEVPSHLCGRRLLRGEWTLRCADHLRAPAGDRRADGHASLPASL